MTDCSRRTRRAQRVNFAKERRPRSAGREDYSRSKWAATTCTPLLIKMRAIRKTLKMLVSEEFALPVVCAGRFRFKHQCVLDIVRCSELDSRGGVASRAKGSTASPYRFVRQQTSGDNNRSATFLRAWGNTLTQKENKMSKILSTAIVAGSSALASRLRRSPPTRRRPRPSARS